MTVNANITFADFQKLADGVQSAFLNKQAVVVLLPVGTKLFKLSAGEIKAHPQYGITAWWSSVLPFKEDSLGASGRFREACLNKVDMREMVRFAAAVSVDWNSLDNYLEVELTEAANGYWGKFTPQPALQNPDSLQSKVKSFNHAMKGVHTPESLGGIDSWQLYIPNLKEEHIKKTGSISSTDMNKLAVHFQVKL